MYTFAKYCSGVCMFLTNRIDVRDALMMAVVFTLGYPMVPYKLSYYYHCNY